MTLDRTGEDRSEAEQAVHSCRNGWVSKPDADVAQLCWCRKRYHRRPVQEYLEPNPSPRAQRAYDIAG
jgi:hypothetical protein